MTGPPAATAAVRLAVRRALADVTGPVAAAVSGGADSLAVAAALAFERPSSYALVVDHRLQPGSGEVAARAADQCRNLGLVAQVLTAAASPVDHRGPSRVSGPGNPTETSVINGLASGEGQGPEARARAVRYALLEGAASNLGLAAVLLGHTRDDQAETVLLGLARGSGARSLAGMAAVRGIFRRPLLDLDRAIVRQACTEAGLTPWEDPHNTDAAYSRSRVRSRALPALEEEVGPGVAAGLARSARLLREDADALDALTPELPTEPSCTELAALPAALRTRALKRWAERLTGCALTSAHVDALRALVDDWSGQGAVHLPGDVRVRRTEGRLVPGGG
jgi:tRNA(Ile)-lysidine synthase